MTRQKIAATLFAALLPVAALADGHSIGDPEAGAEVFKKECSKCHMVGEGAKNRVGPELNRVFGRAAGHVEDFKYSKGMIRMGADGLTWTLETLDPYLTNPRALVSGTKMSYKGLKDETARGDLLAYLRTFSDQPQNIPEAEPTALAEGNPVLAPEVLALVGDAAVLHYLAMQIADHPPADATDNPAFEAAMKPFMASVEALQTAVQSGDAAAAKKAIGGLKPPYSKLFLQFG